MLLATTRICARPVAFYNNFDKYNRKEVPEDDIVCSNVLQSPTGSVVNSSQSESYGGFPLVDPLSVWVELPYLIKGYGEKAMELKLAGNALNRFQNDTEDKETHKQNKVLSYI